MLFGGIYSQLWVDMYHAVGCDVLMFFWVPGRLEPIMPA